MQKKYLTAQTFLQMVLWGLIVTLIISVIILSYVPPVSRDALTHHLAVPKLWLKHGGICEIPSLTHSYNPMNLDILFMIPLYLGNDIFAKYIHFGFALLTAWLIFRYLKKRLNSLYALIGILFFLSLPIIVKLSINVYVDLGLLFFSTASLLSLLQWMENHFHLKYLIIAAVWCGLAIGTKYNGLVLCFLLTLFVPFIFSHAMYLQKKNKMLFQNEVRAITYGAIFILISLTVFSPWMIRNYLWTGNPLYPLYDKHFNPTPISEELLNLNDKDAVRYISAKESWWQTISSIGGHFTFRTVNYHESWFQIALIPVRIFFQGEDGNPRYFDGKLNPLLFFFLFLLFCIARMPNGFMMKTRRMLIASFLKKKYSLPFQSCFF